MTEAERLKIELAHLEKLRRLQEFLQQIRYLDMTAAYMNQIFII